MKAAMILECMIRGDLGGADAAGDCAGFRLTLLRPATVSISRTADQLWQIPAGRQGARVFKPTAFARAAWRVS